MKDFKEAAPYMDTVLKSLGKNPRTVKRFVNTVSFNLWVANEKQRNTVGYCFCVKITTKWCVNTK
ncbi:MAG: hypothetical protein SCALA701_29530 [Candidatus Scalindua sp.]|nr:hypothetical protein [Planctomycetota bacterium]RZV69634.1 MAG: hypothetical protein EX341_15875 [Candidatus Scalindua sp. SCAELEC01]GJQ60152.1 MAG: hypothetical protein SCALA701_29530 [Candidatus Scalindua sp.]